MNVDQFKHKVVEYFSHEMLPKITNPLERFMGYMALGTGNVEHIMDPYIDMARSINIVSNDNIDISKLHQALMYAFNNVPNISLMGFTFTKADVDPFIGFIQR